MRRVFHRYFTLAEERQLFAAMAKLADVHARRDLAWMKLLRQTGIRVETLAGLNVYDARQAIATKYLTLRPEITKRGQGGSVFVTAKAKAALGELLKIRREMGYADSPDEPLILSRKHQRMSVRAFQDRTRHWCKAAGLEIEASPHWFRHTLAKRIMQQSTASDPRGVVQVALCHKSISSTSVYTQPDREDVQRAMEEAS